MIRVLIVACVVAWSIPLLGWGQTLEQLPAGEMGARAAEIVERIGDLGNADFTVRESASDALVGIGAEALPFLRAVSPAATYEVRHRVALLRDRIEAAKFARLSKSFLLDLDAEASYGLPAWDVYRALVGASRTSKLMFLEMVRRQPEVSRKIEAASRSGASAADRRLLVEAAGREATRIRDAWYTRLEPELGDAVGMLMVAATLDTQTPVEVSEVIVNCDRRSFGGDINKQGYGNCLKHLLEAWVPKTHEGLAPAVMDIALRRDLPSGAVIARRHLTANFDSETRKLAFYCLARFGDEADIDQILPLLDDQAVVDRFARDGGMLGIHESNAAPPGLFEAPVAEIDLVVRVSDLALVTLMLLSDENPREVFGRFQPHPQLGFLVDSLATAQDASEQRKQAIERWRQRHVRPAAKS